MKRGHLLFGRSTTLLVIATLALLNLGLLPAAPAPTVHWLSALEYEPAAVQHGEWWRLLTCNLVHFGLSHFLLDMGVFLVLGWLYEPYFARAFPWLLLVMGLSCGVSSWLVLDDHARLRGLSGVDSGLFAAALYVEVLLARSDPTRWFWVAPAGALFLTKLVYEMVTGHSMIGTQVLLGSGRLATAAHLAGVASGLLFCAATKLPAIPSSPAFSPGSHPAETRDP